MNITQRKHVISRLSRLRNDRVAEYEAALHREYDKKRGGPLTVGKLISGIKDGTIKKLKDVKPSEVVDWHLTDVTDIFNIQLFDDGNYPDEMDDKVSKFESKLQAETDRIEDELILGDAENALEAIANFEKFAANLK